MTEETFKQFEALSARVDVWIDEENYSAIVGDGRVYGALQLRGKHGRLVRDCFAHPHCANDYSIEQAWTELWKEFPSVSKDLKAWHPKSQVARIAADSRMDKDTLASWLRLLWAKLIRALIQQKGSDCYFGRFDQLVAVLENCLPRPQTGCTDQTKLAVLYLLEMSAASVRFEQLGFADRAHRILMEHFPEDDDFRAYYDLWAKFNLGVGHFHQSRYRQAVLEFNEVIRQIKRVLDGKHDEGQDSGGQSSRRAQFFRDRLAVEVLLVPSVVFRATVQLKLQMAYHALATLEKYRSYWQTDPPAEAPNGTLLNYKELKARCIKVEAYWQMDDSETSWRLLQDLYNDLFHAELGEQDQCTFARLCDGERQRNLKSQALSLLIDHHLSRLGSALEAMDEKAAGWYLDRLNRAFRLYYDAVRLVATNRAGYYEQLARYLHVLVPDGTDDDTANKQGRMRAARSAYEERRSGLLEREQTQPHGCRHCSRQGIDLRRLNSEHYDQYKEHMLRFFKGARSSKEMPAGMPQDETEFIKRIKQMERESREALRVNEKELESRLEEIDSSWKPKCGDCLNGVVKREALNSLLGCKLGKKCEVGFLQHPHYERVMDSWREHFFGHLMQVSSHDIKGIGIQQGEAVRFIGLQRWNSASPAQGRSVGGGYLIYHNDPSGAVDLGIAVDPGFDFVRNLFHMGFSLADIDIVLISHAHIDHCRDFESMVMLLLEVKKRRQHQKRLHVVFTLGAYHVLQQVIERPSFREHVEPYIIDIEKEVEPKYFEGLPGSLAFSFEKVTGAADAPRQEAGGTGARRDSDRVRYRPIIPGSEHSGRSEVSVEIRPTRALHQDYSGYSDSFGFRISIIVNSRTTPCVVTIGYTGDTRWDPGIIQQYSGCDVVLIHIGSLIKPEPAVNSAGSWYQFKKYSEPGKCEELLRTVNHPYLVGTLRMLSAAARSPRPGDQRPLVLLSEFGEELRGGIRNDLVRRLRQAYEGRLDFLPVDVGLDVLLWMGTDSCSLSSEGSKGFTPKVRCTVCDEYVDVGLAEFDHYGEDEGLFCVCSTCRSGMPHNVVQDRIRRLYETGRELRPARTGR